MSNTRLLATITLAAVVASALTAGLLVPHARASVPPQVECKLIVTAIGEAPPYQKFITENLAAGRTTIFAARDGLLCAW